MIRDKLFHEIGVFAHFLNALNVRDNHRDYTVVVQQHGFWRIREQALESRFGSRVVVCLGRSWSVCGARGHIRKHLTTL